MKKAHKSPKPPKSEGRSRKKKILLIAVGVLALLVIVAHLVLPGMLLRFANRKLNEIPGYRGHIEDVDISLLRGAYTIKQMRLDKLNGKVPVPFFSAKKIDLSVQWMALFHGKIVSEISLLGPTLNFVAGPDTSAQTGIDTVWKQKVEDLFPFTLNRFEIDEGEIHFRNYHSSPKVDLHADHLHVVVTGLTNAQSPASVLPAAFHATGKVMDRADLRVELHVAPLADHPTFDLNAELKGLDLTTLNDFFRAYGDFDVERGSISIFTEMEASGGRFKGYVKPLTKDLKILNVKKDDSNPLHLAWEAVVAGVATIFENRPAVQVGTQIPFSGNFDDPTAEVWSSVGYLLRNAFIRALSPQINNSIHFEGGVTPAQEKHQEKKEAKKS